MVNLILIVFIVLFLIVIVLFAKLFLYVKRIDDKLNNNIEYVQNLTKSVKTVIHDKYLKEDGRLVKNTIARERELGNYNGVDYENLLHTEEVNL